MSKTLIANTNLARVPANSIKANTSGSVAQPIDLAVPDNSIVCNPTGAGGLTSLVIPDNSIVCNPTGTSGLTALVIPDNSIVCNPTGTSGLTALALKENQVFCNPTGTVGLTGLTIGTNQFVGNIGSGLAAITLSASGGLTLNTSVANRATIDGSLKVSKSGDTMTGALILPSGLLTNNLQATTKQYVDDTTVSKSGDTMTGNLTLPLEQTSSLHAVTKYYVDDVTGTLTGMIAPFAMNRTPAGWLPCDGTTRNILDFERLYEAIGNLYNTGGESVTTFRLPDLRGYFVRGFGTHSDGTTSGGVFGRRQDDAMQSHRHRITMTDVMTDIYSNQGSGAIAYTNINGNYGLGPTRFEDNRLTTAPLSGSTIGDTGLARTSNETRPANIALRYCIKF